MFLQIEGASIDKQDHVERPCEQIGETIALDRAIKVALQFARTHPDTLIVVTADHAHTSQIVPVPSVDDATRPGTLSTLLTKVDQSLMTINYGTRVHGQSQDPPDRKCASPRRARRPRTWWASPIRPICSTRSPERWDWNNRGGVAGAVRCNRPDRATLAGQDSSLVAAGRRLASPIPPLPATPQFETAPGAKGRRFVAGVPRHVKFLTCLLGAMQLF